MFTERERDRLRRCLAERASTELAITSAAVVGSGARGTSDRWSDIDLAFEIAPEADAVAVADRWTRMLGEWCVVADTLDLWSGRGLYRVHLLSSSLQVDLSFWPGGIVVGNQAYELLFGSVDASESTRPPVKAANLRQHAAWGWLYALHVRSALVRGRAWQAIQMLNGMRDQVISLTCPRFGVEIHHGRGVDRLPRSVLEGLSRTLPSTADTRAIAPAYRQALELLSVEISHVDPRLANALRAPLATLGATARTETSGP